MITHIAEFNSSGIPSNWAEANFQSIMPSDGIRSEPGSVAKSLLLYSPTIPRLSAGGLSAALRRTYSFLDKTGGWWGRGCDPLNNFEPMEWGCFKPDSPRLDADGKPRKYEYPLQTSQRIFLPINPDDSQCWQRASDDPSIIRRRIEGFKKSVAVAAADTSSVCVGIPSMWGLTIKDKLDGSFHLRPDLEFLATHGSLWELIPDNDAKQKTQEQGRAAVTRDIRVLEARGCIVSIKRVPPAYKGADDFLAAVGLPAFQKWLAEPGIPAEIWEAQALALLSSPPTQEIDSRFLPDIDFPESGIVFIKSPKGTGKSEQLAQLCRSLRHQYPPRKVLVLGHRVALLRALCERFGIPYIEDVRKCTANLGRGLCVDSLHSEGQQGGFRSEGWAGAIVIIDEVEQVMKHLLISSTCRQHRVAILQAFTTLIQEIKHSGGLLVACDADLTQKAINYIKNLWGEGFTYELIYNSYKSEKSSTLASYDNRGELISVARQAIANGEKILILCDAAETRSSWGTKNLQALFKLHYADKISSRIDQESLGDSTESAYGCMENLNQWLRDNQLDILFGSPSICTGVSIDEQCFDKIFFFGNGVIIPTDVCQFLARYRGKAERHIFLPKTGRFSEGNGSANPQALYAASDTKAKINLDLLGGGVDPKDLYGGEETKAHLQAYYEYAAFINSGRWSYREQCLWLLAEEYEQQLSESDLAKMIHSESPDPEMAQIISDGAEQAKANNREVTELKDEQWQKESRDVASSKNLTPEEAISRKKERCLTRAERLELRKHDLQHRYALGEEAEMPEDLHIRDGKGWYKLIRFHYFLLNWAFCVSEGNEILLSKLIQGQGQVFLPDLNLWCGKIRAFSLLGFVQLMQEDGERYHEHHPLIERIAQLLRDCRQDIKLHLGLTIAPKMGNMQLIQYVLRQTIGCPLTQVDREAWRDEEGKVRTRRIFCWQPPADGREAIFARWDDGVRSRELAPPTTMGLALERIAHRAALLESAATMLREAEATAGL